MSSIQGTTRHKSNSNDGNSIKASNSKSNKDNDLEKGDKAAQRSISDSKNLSSKNHHK